MSTPQNNNKDVVYVDIDDEITGIIDKVRGSDQKIVALVLPKRATALQSIVNMKLLKRTSDQAKKHVVLITSETGLMPLAGNVGLFVAKNLQSKPEIPTGPPKLSDATEEVEEALGSDATEAGVDKTKPIGELAATAHHLDEDESIELDDLPEPTASAGVPGKNKKDKKFKIPNFNKFRLWLVAGGALLIALIAFGYFATVVMPKATILVKTDSSAVTVSGEVTLNTGATAIDVKAGIVPASLQQTQKSGTQQVAATGQVNKGTKAPGTVKFYNCNKDDAVSGDPRTVAAGTGISANGLTFITTEAASVPPSHFKASGECKKDAPSTSIKVAAQNGGANYNIAASTFTVAGYSSMSAEGTAMAGGTDDIVKIVSQADIDSAKQKLTAQDQTAVKLELQKALSDKSFTPLPVTFLPGAPDIQTSVTAGTEAANVTVTQKVTYSMMGAKQVDLEKIVAEKAADKIDTKKQGILDYGLDKAEFRQQSQTATGAVLVLQTTLIAGPDLNVDSLKQQIAGKKAGAARDLLKSYPGVTDVDVRYSPFWVNTITKKVNKIQLQIEKPKISDAKS